MQPIYRGKNTDRQSSVMKWCYSGVSCMLRLFGGSIAASPSRDVQSLHHLLRRCTGIRFRHALLRRADVTDRPIKEQVNTVAHSLAIQLCLSPMADTHYWLCLGFILKGKGKDKGRRVVWGLFTPTTFQWASIVTSALSSSLSLRCRRRDAVVKWGKLPICLPCRMNGLIGRLVPEGRCELSTCGTLIIDERPSVAFYWALITLGECTAVARKTLQWTESCKWSSWSPTLRCEDRIDQNEEMTVSKASYGRLDSRGPVLQVVLELFDLRTVRNNEAKTWHRYAD